MVRRNACCETKLVVFTDVFMRVLLFFITYFQVPIVLYLEAMSRRRSWILRARPHQYTTLIIMISILDIFGLTS